MSISLSKDGCACNRTSRPQVNVAPCETMCPNHKVENPALDVIWIPGTCKHFSVCWKPFNNFHFSLSMIVRTFYAVVCQLPTFLHKSHIRIKSSFTAVTQNQPPSLLFLPPPHSPQHHPTATAIAIALTLHNICQTWFAFKPKTTHRRQSKS